MFMVLLFLAAVILAVFIIDYCMHCSEISRKFNEIPGMRRLPLIGSGLDVIGTPVRFFYQSRGVANCFRHKHNICRVNITNIKIIALFDPEDIEILLSSIKHIEKGFVYNFLHSWLNEGLLTSKGAKWQKRRKILTPTFHFNILKQFCKIFAEQSDILVKKLQGEVEKEETLIQPLITDFALCVISETAMGTNLNSTKENVNNYKKAVYDMGETIVNRFTNVWLQIPFIYKFTSHHKIEENAIDILHKFTSSIIKERRSNQSNDKDQDNFKYFVEENVLGMKKRMAMLDLLLKAEAEGKIDNSGIREEVDTFMFEGHDTTTMSIVFTLMLLANHPETQEKIFDELNDIFANSDELPTIEDYNKMYYLEMCLKESLRLYPSVPTIGRYLTEDLKLKKFTIPAGTTVFAQIFDLHRNPELYKDPDRFEPERFSTENSRIRHPYAYIPFSAGPRNCIGQKFALLEEKAILSAIIKNYKLKPITKPEDVVFFTDLVLRSKVPIKIKFISRTKNTE